MIRSCDLITGLLKEKLKKKKDGIKSVKENGFVLWN